MKFFKPRLASMTSMSLVFLLITIGVFHAQAYHHNASEHLLHRFYTTAQDPQAVCNDGSPGVYYYRPGTGSGSHRWVIRFQGGGWCWDEDSCNARYEATPYLMSTELCQAAMGPSLQMPGIPDVVAQPHGILSDSPEDNPDFHSWNHVYIWYCTSDSHLGDAPSGTPDTGKFQYRGKRVTAAAIHMLLQDRGLGDATDVLVTGDSAGGVACMNNARFVREIMQPHAPKLQTFKAFVDAGWFLDIPSYSQDPAAFSFRMCAQALATRWNASFDRGCTDAFAGEPWKCFHAEYAHRYLQVPTFFHEYLYDSANLGFDAAGDTADAEDFRSQLTTSLVAAATVAGLPVHVEVAGSMPAAGDTLRPLQFLPSTAAVAKLGTELRAKAEKLHLKASVNKVPEQGSDGKSAVRVKVTAKIMDVGEGGGGRRRLRRAAGGAAPTRAAIKARIRALLDAQGSGRTETPPRGHLAIFAPACHLHEMIDTSLFAASHIGRAHLSQELAQWFHNGDLPRLAVLDGHPGARSDAECGAPEIGFDDRLPIWLK